MDFTSLPTSLQNAHVAARFDALAMGAASEACGSPGEVANEPTEGHHFHIDGNGAIGDASRLTYWALDKYDGDMEVVHAHLAQHAPDQLRQRAAHALIQIFVISWEGDLIAVKKLHTMASPIFTRLPPHIHTHPDRLVFSCLPVIAFKCLPHPDRLVNEGLSINWNSGVHL